MSARASAGATRRRFLGVFSGAAAAAALLRPSPAGAQAAPATPPPVSPSPTPAAEQKPSLLMQLARERYGKFLTEEQAARLDERVAGLERTSARLRALKFGNGEEPTTDFRVKRSSFARASEDK